jgi:mannosyltransferase
MNADTLSATLDDRGSRSDAHDRASAIRKPALAGLFRLVWLWPALLALILGTYHLTRPELWRDELATWDAATRTTGQLFWLLQHTDASSGAYYLFMHGWISIFGDSVFALRLPSVLAMAAAAALTALIAKRMFGDRAALSAGIVFALLPAVSRFAQEARSYALTVFAVALVTLLLLRALDRPGWRRWTGYALGVALVGVLNLVALTFLAGHLVVVAVSWWQRRDRRVLIGFPLATVAGFVLLLPVVRLGLRQVGNQFQLRSPDLGSVFAAWPQLFLSAMVAGAVTVAAPLALGASRRQAVNGLAMAMLPIVAIWIVSQGDTSYWLARYLTFTLPAWAVVAGAGVAALRPAAAVAGLVVLAMLGVPDQRALRAPDSHDWWNYPDPAPASPFSYAGAAAVIAKDYRPGDGLVPVREVIPYYMIDTGLRYNLPADVQPRDIFAAHTGIELGKFFTEETTDPQAALGDVQRLWLVRAGQPSDPLEDLSPGKAQVLRDNFIVTRVVHPSGMATVALLERKPVAVAQPQGKAHS